MRGLDGGFFEHIFELLFFLSSFASFFLYPVVLGNCWISRQEEDGEGIRGVC